MTSARLMSFTQYGSPITLHFVLSLAWILCGPGGKAETIYEVQVQPGVVSPIGSPVTLSIDFFTHAIPGFLYKPTEVTFDSQFKKYLIKVYLDSGPLSALGGYSEQVNLGPLTPGNYVYEVQLYPLYWGPLDRRIAVGSFTVAPQLSIKRTGTNIVVEWPKIADYYYLRSSTNLAFSRWVQVYVLPDSGTNFVYVINATNAAQFFRLATPPPIGP